jgi:hypothetical protein
MTTKLIRLKDGLLVEVETTAKDAQQIASKQMKEVEETIDSISPILIKVCSPVLAAWKELNKDMNIAEAEIELGLSFEGEGNIFVTKAKAGANLSIKLILKPTE